MDEIELTYSIDRYLPLMALSDMTLLLGMTDSAVCGTRKHPRITLNNGEGADSKTVRKPDVRVFGRRCEMKRRGVTHAGCE